MVSSTTSLALLGTGLMGRPMAERLLDAGFRLAVWNRTPSKARPLADRGATVADTVMEAVTGAEGIILTLTDGAAICDTLFSDPIRSQLAGRTILQMGTIGPTESRDIAQEIAALGGQYLEAPVLGSVPEVRSANLIVMVGGEEVLFEKWLPVLRNFGPAPRRVGDVGHAATLKLAMNQLIASITSAYALSLGMVRRAGLDIDLYVETVRKSALRAPTFDKKLPKMLDRDFTSANFPARHMLKDVSLVLDEARRLGLATPALEGVRELLESTVELGFGDQDYSALAAAVEPPDRQFRLR